MDIIELKREQKKLAYKVNLKKELLDVRTVGGISSHVVGDGLLATVVVCDYPSCEVLEKKSYLLKNVLPQMKGYDSFRHIPAMLEAINALESEPDVLLVDRCGVAHPRMMGVATHLGLSLGIPTIGITEKLSFGTVVDCKILICGEVRGEEVLTREFAKPVFISPGHLVSLCASLDLVSKTLKHPHKMPEPLHLAQRIGKKRAKKMLEKK